MGLFENGFGEDSAYHLFGWPPVGFPERRDGNVWEILELLFTDVEANGEQQGYERAAKKYEKIFQEVKNEYHWTRKVLEACIGSYNTRLEVLTVWLEMLKKEEEELKEQIARREREVSKKYHIPTGDLEALVSDGSEGVDRPYQPDVLRMMCRCYKEKKFREAEWRGYARAKELYVRKIDEVTRELKELQEKGDEQIQELAGQMGELLDEILEEKIRIIELEGLPRKK